MLTFGESTVVWFVPPGGDSVVVALHRCVLTACHGRAHVVNLGPLQALRRCKDSQDLALLKAN